MLFRRRKVPRYTLRDVPYRPAREIFDTSGTYSLIFKFFRTYMMPQFWRLAIYTLMATLNVCSVYLMSYYGKVVVDDILMVSVTPQVETSVRDTQTRLATMDAPFTAERTAVSRNAEGDTPWVSERKTMGYVSDDFNHHNPPQRKPNAAGRLAFIFVLYLGTIILLNRGMKYATLMRHQIGRALAIHLRNDVHRKVVEMSSIYHKSTTPGRLMSRILNDVNSLRDGLVMHSEMLVSRSIMFFVGFAILLHLNWVCALIVVGAMIPYTMAMRASRIKIKTFSREVRHSNACLWGLVSQKLDAMKAIIAYGRERAERLNFFRLSAVMQRDAIQQQHVGASVGRSAQLVSAVTTQGITIYCASQVLDGRMTLGEMMYVTGAVVNLFVPILNLTNLTVGISNQLVIMQRLWYMLSSTNYIHEDPDAVELPQPLERGIRMDHVDFAYGKDAPTVLHNINLDIQAGSWVCVMGPSGAGKSTFVGLLSRLYEPTTGSIFYDDVDLEKVELASLRSNMAVVPQEAQIFSGTIRDNISYGYPDALPQTIINAAQAADCHEFIINLPVQYETIIGEKGTSLSGGQRQRISIARALLTNPEILILDDCTSALDANTEKKIQESLAKVMENRTAVIVSQRVSMAMHCDKIIVLEEGCVTEYGTHEELAAGNGFYSRLYVQQTGQAE